ncbi:MAG: hypothetical protein UIM53_05495, partial [Acutalibacteraceae bacterium]|nr:hypothetical protein [Acutalibacteraceae bacterium]
MKKVYIKKVLIATAVLIAFGAFGTVVSADNKVGCVDIFDAKNQTENSITLQWDKGINTDGYVIYRKDSSQKSDYIKLIDINNPNVTTLEDTSVESGKLYDYQIKSYSIQEDEVVYSKGEVVKTASSPLAVKNFELEIQNEKSISLKWEKSDDATGYTIYRMDYTSGGKYQKVCDVEGIEKYTDKNLTPSHKYYYYIKAYIDVNGEKSYSKESSIIKTATNPSQVQNLKASKQTKDSVTIKWDKSQNASGYVIYRMTNNEYDYEGEWIIDDYGYWSYVTRVGEYIKYAVINDGDKTSYTNKDLNQCQAYYYRVVPYFKADGKYYYGDYRNISTGTVTDTPEVTAFSRSNRVMAKWYPVSGAEGYEVYISENKDGPYKSYGTTDDIIFLTKELTDDKDYYVRVRAYYNVDKKNKVYSNFTTQKVKCTKSNKVDKYNVG